MVMGRPEVLRLTAWQIGKLMQAGSTPYTSSPGEKDRTINIRTPCGATNFLFETSCALASTSSGSIRTFGSRRIGVDSS